MRPYNYNDIEDIDNCFWIQSESGGTWYKFPMKSLKMSYESLASDDSGRTLDGVMHIYWVKRNLNKFEIVLPPVTANTILSLVNLVQGKEYYIRLPFGKIGGVQTFNIKHVYTSNANTSMYSGVLYGGLWQDFTFHAIELGD